MSVHSRRTFLKAGAACGSLRPDLLRAQSRPGAKYDLLVRGGHLIDPSQGISAERDVAISGRTVARVAPGIPEAEARQVLDARGKIVTPGLVDIHVHVYDG